MMSWIIVGLGNPGEQYENTRHNVGRVALEHFAKLHDLPELKEEKKNNAHVSKGALKKTLLELVAPDTYMNKSGNAVAKFVKSQKAAQQLIVVYDDLDLPLGTMKLSFDRGSGGHRGLESVIRAVKTKKFTRVRIGISPMTAAGKPKKPGGEKEVLDFILAKFRPTEMELLRRVFKKSTEAVGAIVLEGVTRAMNEFNSDAR